MFLILLVLVFTFLLIFYYKSIRDHISITKHLRKLPGPPYKNFLLGNISDAIGTPEHLYKTGRKWGRDYYPIYQVSALYRSVACIVNPEDFETILSNSKHNTKADFYENLHPWLGTGLLTSHGPKWLARRKILTPTFHFNILQEFSNVFKEETRVLVEKLKRECHKPHICVNQHVNDYTLDSIGRTAMGIDFGGDNEKCKKYKRDVTEMADLFVYRLTKPWLYYNFMYFFHPHYHKVKLLIKKLHEFTTGVIQERAETFQPNFQNVGPKRRLAMLDLLLTASNEGSINTEGIREEVDTFMFEGHDTTSSAICSALLVLANYREVQDRVYDEIQRCANIQDMKYMEMCIKEVLRLYPSVIMIGRQLGEDITTHSGHFLKAGSFVYLQIVDVHLNPDIYPEPGKFDPDRFLPENCQKRHPFAYVPFSAGPRNCIGQKFAMLEIKTVLSGILSEFILEAVDTRESVVTWPGFVLKFKDDVRVRFVPRVEPKV